MNIEQPQYFESEFIPGEEYEDRAGNKYIFIGFAGDWPIFKGDFSERYFQRYRDGTADEVCNPPGIGDIIRHVLKPKPKVKVKRTVWVNVFPIEEGRHNPSFNSKQEAQEWGRKALDRIACIPVEIEYEEGEGL